VPNNTALLILVKVKKQRRFQFISKVMLAALKMEDISSGNSCMSTVFWRRYAWGFNMVLLTLSRLMIKPRKRLR